MGILTTQTINSCTLNGTLKHGALTRSSAGLGLIGEYQPCAVFSRDDIRVSNGS